MVRPTPNTTTDYLLVDGLESVTLKHSSGSPSITVEHAKRSRIRATNQLTGIYANQLTGIQPGEVLWDLAKAEVVGDITKPLAGQFIETEAERFVIRSVSDLVISGIWQCVTTVSETVL